MTLHWTATAFQLRLVISEFGCDRSFLVSYLLLSAERCQQLLCKIDTDHGNCFETPPSALYAFYGLANLKRVGSTFRQLGSMAPRVLTISDIRVTNFNSPQQSSQQMPCCSFELGMARVSTTTVRYDCLVKCKTSAARGTKFVLKRGNM